MHVDSVCPVTRLGRRAKSTFSGESIMQVTHERVVLLTGTMRAQFSSSNDAICTGDKKSNEQAVYLRLLR